MLCLFVGCLIWRFDSYVFAFEMQGQSLLVAFVSILCLFSWLVPGLFFGDFELGIIYIFSGGVPFCC